MESVQILAKVNDEKELPGDWLVFPLIRQKVIIGIIGWIAGALVGGLLFAFIAPVMIPHNYQSGVAPAIISTIILAIVLYICLGSLWAIIIDILRLRHADKHLIIITPSDFVKQEGDKIIHVPLEYVKYVTARGSQPVDRSIEAAREDADTSNAGARIGNLFFGGGLSESQSRRVRRKRSRTPSTLAFMDSRTDKEVIVVTDKCYGDPYYIAAHLKAYASQYQVK